MILIFTRKLDVQWFAQQHPWYAEQCNEHKYPLDRRLTIEHVLLATGQWWGVFEQHHVDEHNQYRGSTAWRIRLEIGCGRIGDPFEEHHEHHVSEQQQQKQNLWEKFQKNAGQTLKVQKIDHRHANTKYHVSYSSDNGQFHFVGIQKDDLVVCHLPNGI